MRSEERGKAGRVLLLALLCASGASVPVVALRPRAPVEEAVSSEPAAVKNLDAPQPVEPGQSVPEDAPEIAASEPSIPAEAAPPGPSLDDRLLSYFVG